MPDCICSEGRIFPECVTLQADLADSRAMVEHLAANPRRVWITVLDGVFRHGFGGVHSTKSAALAHAKDMFINSDRYHDIEVVEMTMDELLWPRYLTSADSPVSDKPWTLQDSNRIHEVIEREQA